MANTTPLEKAKESIEHIRSLNSNCKSFFEKGETFLFRSISVTLRMLLAGSSGQNGLIKDCLSDPRLFSLRCALPADIQVGFCHIPATLMGGFYNTPNATRKGIGPQFGPSATINGSDFSLHYIFDEQAQTMSLTEWLKQGFLHRDQTLEIFIKRMANKAGGAHFDPTDEIKRFEQLGDIHQHLTAHIAQSVGPQLERQIKAEHSL